MSIESDIQKLDPGAIVELFVLDATAQGGELFRFHAGTNELNADVVWQGHPYARFPVEASGFEIRGTGTSPRPTIRVANIGGLMGAIVRANDDLIGAKLTRRRTFVRYLDAANFAAGNTLADPNAHFPDQVFYVDRKSTENRIMIEWELVSALDLSHVKLPRRQIIANLCTWKYRSAECGYTGGPVADLQDNPTTDPAHDRCSKRLSACKLRWGEGAVLPYGGFPAAGLTRA